MSQIKSLRTGIKFKDTPIGKIPVDWEVTKLGDVATAFQNGGTPDTKIKEYWGGDIPWITGADLINQRVGQTRKYITPEGVKNSATSIVPKGSLLVVTRTGVGKLAIAPFDIAISQDISGVIPDKQKSLPNFLFWNLNYNEKKLKALKQGTSINGILREDLSSLLISLPPLPEQKKIAEILTTVDDAIEETDRIIEKTKELKKGLMQKLLTCGIGHKKFKRTEIGEIPEDWEVGKISDYGEIVTGSTPSTLVKEYYGNDFPFVSPFDLGKAKVIIKTEKYISKEGASVARMLPANTILFVCIGSTIGKTGVAGVQLATNQQINAIICEGSDFNFVYYYLSFISDKIKQIAGTQAVPIVNKSLFSNVLVVVPRLKEQQEIGKILSSVDTELEDEENHKHTLESLKKSLMQILLTGKVRVKFH